MFYEKTKKTFIWVKNKVLHSLDNLQGCGKILNFFIYLKTIFEINNKLTETTSCGKFQ